jgi:hypothetical protein
VFIEFIVFKFALWLNGGRADELKRIGNLGAAAADRFESIEPLYFLKTFVDDDVEGVDDD